MGIEASDDDGGTRQFSAAPYVFYVVARKNCPHLMAGFNERRWTTRILSRVVHSTVSFALRDAY